MHQAMGAGAERTLQNTRRRSAGIACKRPLGHPAHGRSGVAAGLLARRSMSVFSLPDACASVTSIETDSLLTVAGAAPEYDAKTASSPTSLLATKSCDVADRDIYIWCDPRRSVKQALRSPTTNPARLLVQWTTACVAETAGSLAVSERCDSLSGSTVRGKTSPSIDGGCRAEPDNEH